MYVDKLTNLRYVTQKLVDESIFNYELVNGDIGGFAYKSEIRGKLIELSTTLFDRVELDEGVSIVPFKTVLIDLLVISSFDSPLLSGLVKSLMQRIYDEIDGRELDKIDFIRTLNSYEVIILKGIENYISELFFTSILETLKSFDAYQYSETKQKVTPIKIDSDTNTIFTLFDSGRYFEYWKNIPQGQTYSPLKVNQILNSRGLSEYSIKLDYQDLVIYQDKLYKLDKDISNPTKAKFVPSEWVEYSPKRFNKSKSFKATLEASTKIFYDRFVEASFQINSIISDSSVKTYSDPLYPDEDLLVSTWGGDGKEIFKSFRDLNAAADIMGGHESSIIGSMEYISTYMEYFLASTFGKETSEVFDFINNTSTFGHFEVIFVARTANDKIPGLKFLDKFSTLKSFVHRQKVPSDVVTTNQKTLLYNPVYAQFYSGITSRYSPPFIPNTYFNKPTIDILLYSIESLYKVCLAVGDSIESISNSIDANGRLGSFEGLGNIRWQILEASRAFPPSRFLKDYSNKTLGGITGSVRYLLDGYKRLVNATQYPELPGRTMGFFTEWLSLLNSKIAKAIDSLDKVFIEKTGFIPNLAFKNINNNEVNVLRRELSTLNLRDSEINQILQADSFSDLVRIFAPLSDSADLQSFFKAFELTQLLYEFGGQSAINSYLEFLFTGSDISSLLNILEIAQKNLSRSSCVRISEYPKLVGLLIGLTYAIDPNQLVKFSKLLGANNLELLEAIQYLLDSGQNSIIRSRDQIDLLTPLTSQLIQGEYSDIFSSLSINYDQANASMPLALQQWAKILNKDLGSIESKDIVEGLFDKVSGLTAKELMTIFSPNSISGKLTRLLDGFSGGDFTKVIRYAGAIGIGTQLNAYKNSNQLNNFQVRSDNYLNLYVFIENLKKAESLSSIIRNVFDSNLSYTDTALDGSIFDPIVKTLVNTQNKEPRALAEVARNISNTNSIFDTNSFEIIGSPGVGNSPVPNRIPLVNSITPEQERILSQSVVSRQALALGINNQETITNLIDRFIKVNPQNRQLNRIDIIDETSAFKKNSISSVRTPAPRPLDIINKYNPRPEGKQLIEPTEVALSAVEFASRPLQYDPQEIHYQQQGSLRPKKSTSLGLYHSQPSYTYLENASQDIQSLPQSQLYFGFDQIESCVRFGGDQAQCQELYANVGGRCGSPLSKALYPEQQTYLPGSSQNAIQVDRPLGTFNQFKPNRFLLPTENKAPKYFDILPVDSTEISMGEKGEPIVKSFVAQKKPLVFTTGGSEVSEYANTEFGLIEGIKANYEKNTEFECAAFDSPYEYQICMNLMKCKRFSPPYQGKYYFDFCPRGLAGGRLK